MQFFSRQSLNFDLDSLSFEIFMDKLSLILLERNCVCVKESTCVIEIERERKCVCVRESMCVIEIERERERVCEREREYVCDRD